MITPPIQITQGDSAVFQMTAVDGNKNPVDLTSATFTTVVNGPNGQFTVSFPNNQHQANPDQINFQGQFSLTLSELDTESIGVGDHKEIITFITLGSNVIAFRGPNSLQVFAPVPFE